MRRVLLASLAFSSATAHAQAPEAPKAACAFDTAAATRRIEVKLGLGAWDAPFTREDDPLRSIAQAIVDHFRLSDSISLPLAARVLDTFPPSGPRTLIQTRFGLHTGIVFELDSAGRLGTRPVEMSTYSTEMNAALQQAILRADSARAFSLGPATASVHVVLRLVDMRDQPSAVPITQVVVAALVSESGVKPIRIPKPDYPQAARHERRSGWVDLQYVVAADGRAEPGTFHVTGGQQEFLPPTLKVLSKGTFRPPTIGGCPLPILVHQRVSYKSN